MGKSGNAHRRAVRSAVAAVHPIVMVGFLLPALAFSQGLGIADSIRADEVASFEDQRLFAPLVSPRPEGVHVTLLNTTSRGIEPTIKVLDPWGRELYAVQVDLPTRRHVELDLSGELKRHQEASLVVVEAVEAPGAFAAWLRIGSARQEIVTIGFKSATAADQGSLVIWNAASKGSHLIAVNPSTHPTTLAIPGHGDRQVGGNSMVRVKLGGQGAVGLQPGFLVWAFERTGSSQVALPVRALASAGRTQLLHAIGPANSGQLKRASALLANLSGRAQPVFIRVVSDRGITLDSTSANLPAQGSVSIDLLARFSAEDLTRGRLDFSATEPGIAGSVFLTDRRNRVSALPVFEAAQAHNGGTYPLADFGNADTELAIVNLSAAPSTIVGQIASAAGEYSFGPLEVGGFATARFRPQEAMERGDEDLLGRTLPRRIEMGFMKWSVMIGSQDLVARASTGGDSWASRSDFECYGCCWEVPVGLVLPGSVNFFADDTVPLTGSVTYDTCSGFDGPYTVPLSSSEITDPFPFVWTGQQISSSNTPGFETVQFNKTMTAEMLSCNVISVPVEGGATADSCKTTLKKPEGGSWSASQSCNIQQSGKDCDGCKKCCGAQRAHSTCKKKNGAIIASQYNACIANCNLEHCL